MNRNLFKLTSMLLISLLSVAGCSNELTHQSDEIYHHDENAHWKGCVVDGCQEVFEQEEHDWSQWVITKESTCLEYGVQERECNTCKRKEKANVDKLQHSINSIMKYDEQGHWTTCLLCDITIASSRVEHNFDTWQVVKEATVNEQGLEKSICICGYTTERIIPKIEINTQSIQVILPDCISNNSVLLSQGSFDISYKINPTDATDYESVVISSSNEDVATISENKVTLLKEGYTEIIVSNGVKQSIQPLFVTNLLIDGKLQDEIYNQYNADISITDGAGYETTNKSYVMLNDNGLYISHHVTDKYISSLSHIESSICFNENCSEDNTLFLNIYPDTSIYNQVRFFANPKSYDNAIEVNDIKYLSSSNIIKDNNNVEGYEVEVFIPYDQLSKYGCENDVASVKYIPMVYQYFNQADANRASLNKADNDLNKNIAYGEIDTIKAKYLAYLMPTFNKDKTFVSTNKRPIAEYTFDNGQIQNTGTNQSINGRITSINESNSEIVEVSNPNSTFIEDAMGKTNSALLLTNNREGEHFTISGVNLKTNDFTLTVKVNIKELTTYVSSENFLFGIGNSKDAQEGFFGVNYKLNKNRNLTQIRFRINGVTNNLSYVPVGQYCEFRIVRKGNVVTFGFDNDALHGEQLEWQYQLNSTDSLALNNYDIGFSSNIGCSDPGEWPVAYDDIKIYDYAIPM